MKSSFIICSHGRPVQLPACLASVESEAALHKDTEIVLVYNEGDALTAETMNDFSRTSRVSVKVVSSAKRGLSVARNLGIACATGDLLIFTDDDCYMQAGYLGIVLAAMEGNPSYEFGSGGVHDPAFYPPGTVHLTQSGAIAPYTLVPAGIFNGCNMFFRREVFEKIGGFREDMGASSGTSFIGAEDLEMTTRANFAGMTGILLPEAVIIHDHQRKPNSKEMNDALYAYDVSRGSFYAYMMMRGIHEIWSFWGGLSAPNNERKMNRATIERLQKEFFGASEYLAYCLKNNIDI